VGFQGRAALEAQAKTRLPRLLAGFSADPSILLLGRETIYRDGKRVGWLTSGGYGHTVGRAIGYGYIRDPEKGVRRDELLSGRYELEVATARVPAEIFFDPPYDPPMSRVKS
jgi:4-methylaminobutanoate oxidase (formaldehyde-forming)